MAADLADTKEPSIYKCLAYLIHMLPFYDHVPFGLSSCELYTGDFLKPFNKCKGKRRNSGTDDVRACRGHSSVTIDGYAVFSNFNIDHKHKKTTLIKREWLSFQLFPIFQYQYYHPEARDYL